MNYTIIYMLILHKSDLSRRGPDWLSLVRTSITGIRKSSSF